LTTIFFYFLQNFNVGVDSISTPLTSTRHIRDSLWPGLVYPLHIALDPTQGDETKSLTFHGFS